MPSPGTGPPDRPSAWPPFPWAPGSRSRSGPTCRADTRSHCTGGRRDTLEPVLGAVIIVVAMVLVLPVALFVGGALWSALLGTALTRGSALGPAGAPDPPA